MKWIELIPLTYIVGNKIAKFILNYLICYYGIPQTIFIENGTPFKNQDVCDPYTKLHIQHQFSTLYYPQGNDQVEAHQIKPSIKSSKGK